MATTERLDQEITSLIGEVSIPATDNFEIQLGVRYSDYEAADVT